MLREVKISNRLGGSRCFGKKVFNFNFFHFLSIECDVLLDDWSSLFCIALFKRFDCFTPIGMGLRNIRILAGKNENRGQIFVFDILFSFYIDSSIPKIWPQFSTEDG